MKLIVIFILITALTGCSTENTNRAFIGIPNNRIQNRPVTERKLSDFNGTMAYASEASETSEPDSDTYSNENDIPDNQNILAEFTTKFNKNSTNRAENIALAARKIDKKVVYPGEIFSFNETVGPTNSKTGYKRSKIFIRGKEYIGVGGGVCQVSSTLYNAVKNAGLNVTERHPHSRRVQYVQKNNDAAVSYGGIDFKFVNDMEYPIIINSNVLDGEITVSIEAL